MDMDRVTTYHRTKQTARDFSRKDGFVQAQQRIAIWGLQFGLSGPRFSSVQSLIHVRLFATP